MRLILWTLFLLTLHSVPTLAQDNASCDVPCYFGECAPAKASYDVALARCDIERLELVGLLYGGTASGDKAAAAVTTLRLQGYGMSRIRVTPNATGGSAGVQGCTALVEGRPTTEVEASNPCALVDVPSGWRCEVTAGRAKLVQLAVTALPNAATRLPANLPPILATPALLATSQAVDPLKRKL